MLLDEKLEEARMYIVNGDWDGLLECKNRLNFSFRARKYFLYEIVCMMDDLEMYKKLEGEGGRWSGGYKKSKKFNASKIHIYESNNRVERYKEKQRLEKECLEEEMREYAEMIKRRDERICRNDKKI